MKRSIATLTFATAALVATGALAENTVPERRDNLAKLWGQETEITTGPVATAVQRDFSGIGERSREHRPGHWGDNWRGGRKHPPAGH